VGGSNPAGFFFVFDKLLGIHYIRVFLKEAVTRKTDKKTPLFFVPNKSRKKEVL